MIKKGDIFLAQLRLKSTVEWCLKLQQRYEQLNHLAKLLSSPEYTLLWWTQIEYAKANKNWGRVQMPDEIKELQDKIKELEKRVRQLEQQQSPIIEAIGNPLLPKILS